MADNQNKLEDIIGGALELLNDPDYGYDIHPDDLLEVKSVLVTRITANYTPNTKLKALIEASKKLNLEFHGRPDCKNCALQEQLAELTKGTE